MRTNRTESLIDKNLLRTAFIRAEGLHNEKYEKLCDEDILPNLDYRALYEEGKKQRRPVTNQKSRLTWQKAAAFAGVILFLSGVGSLSVEANRDALFGWFASLGEKSDFIRFDSKEAGKEVPNVIEKVYEPDYLPEGFLVSDEVKIPEEEPIEISRTYTDGIHEIHLSQTTLSAEFAIDSEMMTRERVQIGSYQGQINEKEGEVVIVWRTEEYSLELDGDAAKEEMLKIARSIR